ncbi:TonB-dependent receptor [Aurantiacibacter suaedae]|uniref:TonB-dependent receptor n=1 Tax=Aurantiacibacter suaedae TaxID=2545755 RepID=UPI0010F98913|nr:TonB-dependent receptor [Aurantiacibacter suaedae]
MKSQVKTGTVMFKRAALLLGVGSIGLMAMPALAQDAEAERERPSLGLDAIVVTAQRRNESVQDVPIAITAITGEQLAKSNVRGIEDYFAMTPNVSFASNGSRDRKELSLRGVSNQLDPYADVRPSAYAFYIDDFSVIAGTSNPDVVDLERIEVLRGPQGTYFGRNSVGGAINVSTAKPVDYIEGSVSLGFSSFDTKRASAVLNLPIAPGVLAVRFAGQIESSDGNIHNINEIGGGNNTNYKTGRVIARFTPSGNFTNDVTFSYTRERNGMRAGVPTGYLTRTWRNVYYGGAPGPADEDGVGFYPDNTSEVNFNRPQSVGSDFWYVSDRAVWEGDAVTVTGVFGYLKAEIFNRGDVDGGSFDYFYENNLLSRDSLSGELRVQSAGDGPFQWSFGVNAGKDTGDTDQATNFGEAGLLGRAPDDEISGILSSAENTYQAVFAQATYNLTETLAFTVGGRYSHEKVSRVYQRRSNGAITDNIDREKSFNDFSPRFNITYEPNPDLMLYATVSRGFKSGGVQTSQLIQQEFYNPETLWNYEGGVKFTAFDDRLRVDLSGFYMDWNDIQLASRFIYLADDGVTLISVNGIDNATSARSYGIDGSLDFKVMPELTLSLHGGFNDARFREYENAIVDGVTVDASDRPLINAPKWTAGGSLEYRSDISDSFEGFIRPEWTYRSESLSSILALRYFEYPFISPAYHAFNLRAGVDNGTVSVTAYVENLTDKNYYSNVYEKAFYGGVQLEPSVRRFGINAAYRF